VLLGYKQISKSEGHTGEVKSVAWNPLGEKLASESSDKTVLVWDAASGVQVTDSSHVAKTKSPSDLSVQELYKLHSPYFRGNSKQIPLMPRGSPLPSPPFPILRGVPCKWSHVFRDH
jgi:WD40 repeat protein